MTTSEPPPTTPFALGKPTDRLSLDLDWAWRRPKARPRLPKGEPRDDARPVRCLSLATGESMSAPARALPFADGSVGAIDAGTIFAYVRDDDGLAGEIARILRPGGTVSLRVPSTGPLAGFDAYNLFRYVADVTGRGPRIFEVAELGWRRHYPEAEIVAMFGTERFEVQSSRRGGLALSELLRLAGQLAFRWLRPSGDRYRRVSTAADALERRELRLAWHHGFWLTMSMEKRTTAAP